LPDSAGTGTDAALDNLIAGARELRAIFNQSHLTANANAGAKDARR
jgi:hypothetical protein